jgi:hypothetical protein
MSLEIAMRVAPARSASVVGLDLEIPFPSEPDIDPIDDDRRAEGKAKPAGCHRTRAGRRGFEDPTSCEIRRAAAEAEFTRAMNEYKQRSGRMFPTWSEVLEVLQGLGYEKPVGRPAAPEVLSATVARG